MNEGERAEGGGNSCPGAFIMHIIYYNIFLYYFRPATYIWTQKGKRLQRVYHSGECAMQHITTKTIVFT